MVFARWPDHLLSLDEWDELDLDPEQRYELVEGVLRMVPRPRAFHQRVSGRLFAQLDGQLPAQLTVLQDYEVVTDHRYPPSVRAPDLIVVPKATIADNPSRLSASDVCLAVEIVSPGTVRTDTVTKLSEYADAGIGAYWIIEIEPPVSLTAHVLVDGEYEITAQGSGATTLLTPVELRIDFDRLLP